MSGVGNICGSGYICSVLCRVGDGVAYSSGDGETSSWWDVLGVVSLRSEVGVGGDSGSGGGPLAGRLPMGSFWRSDIRAALVSSVGYMTDRAVGSAIDQRWK